MIFIDGSNPGVVSDIKEKIGEDYRKESWQAEIDRAKKIGYSPAEVMSVIPVIFTRQSSAEMTTHSQKMVTSHLLAIPEQFNDLIVEMRIATTTKDGRLDKTQYTMDLFDALRLNLLNYTPKPRKKQIPA